MPNWSRHLPRVGVLVLSAAIAAAAYGVYTGQSSTSVKSTGESLADFPNPSMKAGAGLPSHGGGKPAGGQADRRPSGHAAEGPGFATATMTSAAQPATSSPPLAEPDAQAVEREVRQPVPPRATPRTPNPALDDDALDRELQRVIDEGLPVAPESPPSDEPIDGAPVSDDPVDPIEEPGVPEPGAQPEPDAQPEPAPAAPGSEAPPAAPGPPPADPASPADPDAGLDDTAAGGLDQTDLGAPVDETDQGADATPPPAAPDAAAPDGSSGGSAPDAAQSDTG